jgi:hypothetical protein
MRISSSLPTRDDDGKESRDFFWWGFPYLSLWLPRSRTRVQGHGGPYPAAGCFFAMAEAIGSESLRWNRLVYLSVAQFTAVLASIVNVSLGA